MHFFHPRAASIERQNSLRTLVQIDSIKKLGKLPLKACAFLYGGDPRALPRHSHEEFVSQTALVLIIVQIVFGWDLLAVSMPSPK